MAGTQHTGDGVVLNLGRECGYVSGVTSEGVVMRRARFFAVLALVCVAGCMEPTALPRQGLGRDGNGSGAVVLAFTVQPRATFAGEAMPAVQVTARNGLGTRDITFARSVSLALGTNPGGSALGGTTSATAAAGLATFGGLTLNQPGTGYTLIATASGATGAVSTAFEVLDPTP